MTAQGARVKCCHELSIWASSMCFFNLVFCVFMSLTGINLCDHYGCVGNDSSKCQDILQCTCKPGLDRLNPQVPFCVGKCYNCFQTYLPTLTPSSSIFKKQSWLLWVPMYILTLAQDLGKSWCGAHGQLHMRHILMLLRKEKKNNAQNCNMLHAILGLKRLSLGW